MLASLIAILRRRSRACASGDYGRVIHTPNAQIRQLSAAQAPDVGPWPSLLSTKVHNLNTQTRFFSPGWVRRRPAARKRNVHTANTQLLLSQARLRRASARTLGAGKESKYRHCCRIADTNGLVAGPLADGPPRAHVGFSTGVFAASAFVVPTYGSPYFRPILT